MKTKTTDIAFAPASSLTRATLESCPGRILTFVQGGSHPTMRQKLLPLGWKTAASEAWALIAALNEPSMLDVALHAPDPVPEAIAACERWERTGSVQLRARLQLRFPEQAAFLFDDRPAYGTSNAPFQISFFLSRHEMLTRGDGRPKERRPADRAALALLRDAGITKAVIMELGALIARARGSSRAAADGALREAEVDAAAAARRDIVLRKMHAWLTAWSGIARTVTTRRDDLIRLGIARRRARTPKALTSSPPTG